MIAIYYILNKFSYWYEMPNRKNKINNMKNDRRDMPCPKCGGRQGYTQTENRTLHFNCPICQFSCFMKHYSSEFNDLKKALKII